MKNLKQVLPKEPIGISQPHFIEIEIGSYCNRRCTWCSNHWDDRGTIRNFMNNRTWEKIIDDLAKISYTGWLAFHNYNEPLADPSIFNKIAFVNERLPNAKTAIYTNGDYLNFTTTARLLELSVKEIRVTLYPKQKEMFDPPSDARITELLSKLGITAVKPEVFDGKRGRESHIHVKQTAFHFIVPNIKGYTDRGGSVELVELKTDGQRVSPCYLPNHSAAIDYNGNLKLCCQIYDVQSSTSAEFNIGNVNQTSFWELWTSEKMVAYRYNAASGNFASMSACQNCTHSVSSDQIININA